MWIGMHTQRIPASLAKGRTGQVVALFIVGLGEYAVVWLGTDWEREVQRGIDRNKEEAKRRRLHTREQV